MVIEAPIDCTGKPGCATGAAVVQVAHDLANLKNDVADDRQQCREGRKALHERINTVDGRINMMVWGLFITALSSLGSLIIGLVIYFAGR